MSMRLIAALLLLAAHLPLLADGNEIDLSEASVITDRGDWGYHMMAQGAPPEVIVDGDEQTHWIGDGYYPGINLSTLPANLFIMLPERLAVGSMELLTAEEANNGRITAFEVYARVDDGWALIGQISGNEQPLIALDLLTCKVETLRIRLRGSARGGNARARIHTLRLFSPEPDAELAALSPGEIPEQSSAEWYHERDALGLREPEPRISYDPEKGYLGYVTSFLDTMIEKGTDRYGEVHSPMFVGLLAVADHEHPGAVIPSIPGQRWNDRPFLGGNLSHDRPLLEAMEYVSEYTGDAKYREAADAYLRFFLENCTDTPTGLWPWGEHVYWNFYEDQYRQDNHSHELEGRGTVDFWERAWEINPEAVLGEANGLINHVQDLDTFAYSRHADITRVLPDPRPEDLLRWLLDFPGHGGLKMRIWAFAWSKSGDNTYYGWAERMADYFEDVRLEESGMLPVLSRYAYRPNLRPSPGGTLSVGLSMLESAELLAGTELGERLQRLGGEYLEIVAAGTPDPPAVQVVDRPTASEGRAVSHWEDDGAWIDLKFDIPEAGRYLMTLRYGLAVDSTSRAVLIDGENVGEFELSSTRGWASFETVTPDLGPLSLPAGETILRLVNRDSAGLCLDWVALHGPEGTPEVKVLAADLLASGVPRPKRPEIVVGFDSGYGGVSILSRQISDRSVTGFVGNATSMLAYRMTGDERHLQQAREIAEAYLAIDEVPEYDHLRAGVFGSLIHMMLDMYEVDAQERWLEAAERFAQAGIEGLYRNGLFRGATGQWVYDSHLYVSRFVHGLVRLHAVVEQDETQAPPLYY